MKLIVLAPHFAPDPAPTGEVITRIVHELAALGHELHVVTALPWYVHHAVEPAWRGRLVRRETTPWGSITRVHPFPSDKTSVPRRAISFAAFCGLAGLAAVPGGRADGVLAMSPPLPLGLVGWAASVVHRSPFVFNVQDIFPDVAVRLGKLTNRRVIAASEWLERTTYGLAGAVTVLSDDLRANVSAKVDRARRDHVRVIPNFVDTGFIQPRDRRTAYRQELGIDEDATVVLYAGNVGFSQSLDLVVGAARSLHQRDDVVFLINGGGSALPAVRASAAKLPNVRFAPYQPKGRLAEVLATGDIHVVPLRTGLASSSVPSKTYSSLAAGRPLLAAVDEGTEVARVVADAACGRAVPPDDAVAFEAALAALLDDRPGREAMGRRGRTWVERWASPSAVARSYEALFVEIGVARRGRGRSARS